MSSAFRAHTTAVMLLAAVLAGVGVSPILTAAPADAPESVTSVITRLREQEAPQPVRERPQYRAPKKVVLLEFGNPRGWAGRQEAFAAAAPKAKVVVVKDLASALRETADADVTIGFNPEI